MWKKFCEQDTNEENKLRMKDCLKKSCLTNNTQ